MSIKRAIVKPNKKPLLDKRLAKIGIDKITCHYLPFGCTIVIDKKLCDQGGVGFYLLRHLQAEGLICERNSFKRMIERVHSISDVHFGYSFLDPNDFCNFGFGIRVAMERLIHIENIKPGRQ